MVYNKKQYLFFNYLITFIHKFDDLFNGIIKNNLFTFSYFFKSKESFVQKGNVSLNILLGLFVDPSFEVYKVKCMRKLNFFLFYPLSEKWKVIQDFFTIENSVDHVATKEFHLYLIS